MVAILRLLIGALRNCIMSRGRLEAEVIVLRHQLNILRRQSPKLVRPNAFDRAIFVCLYRHFPDIGNAVAIIRPETVIRWHRSARTHLGLHKDAPHRRPMSAAAASSLATPWVDFTINTVGFSFRNGQLAPPLELLRKLP
jgi:hypothetical protein